MEVTDPDLTPIDTNVGAATEKSLGTLHGVVAQVLTAHLSTANEVSAAMVGAAITFLKNNNITASPTENTALAGLNKALAARRRKGIDPKAAAEAAEQFATMNGANGMPLQ